MKFRADCAQRQGLDVAIFRVTSDMLLSKDMKMKIYSIAELYSSVGDVAEQQYVDQDIFVKLP